MNDIITAVDVELKTTSKIIADVFGKVHRNVVKDIDKLNCSAEFKSVNYVASSYTTERGKTYRCCDLTADGAMFLFMVFTGCNA